MFVQPQYEPVDASLLRSLAGGGSPLPRVSTTTCLATGPDLYGQPIPSTTLCCQYVDTWAFQASSGLYVSTDSVSTNVPFQAFTGYLTTFSPSGGPITSAGPQERFEVYSCVGSGLQDQPTDPHLIALKANNGNFLTGIPPNANVIPLPIVSLGAFPSPDPQWAYFFNLVYYNNGQITLQKAMSNTENPADSLRIDIPKDDVPYLTRRLGGIKYLDTSRPEWQEMKPILDVMNEALKRAGKN